MGRWDWERGEFTLPSAEYAKFRQAIADVDKKHKERVFDQTQSFWKGLSRKQQTDPDEYRKAVSAWADKQYRKNGSLGDESQDTSDVAEMLHYRIKTSWGHDPVTGKYGVISYSKPSRVQQSEMDYPTNRTTDFACPDAGVRFDPERRTVTWSVGQDKNAVERGRASHIGRAFFRQLDKTRWTHGTGGVIAGNDEYNGDDRESGGGANYCNGAYGYLGIEREPMNVREFTNARGQRIKPELKMGRAGFSAKASVVGGPQGRVTRGVPTGGQFSARQRGESDIDLY